MHLEGSFVTTLTITMEHDVGAKALVRAALDNEVRLLEAAIRRTKSRICSFEERFETGTADFLAKYEAGDVQETLEDDEWIGEYRTMERLQDSRNALREARLAD
jgi:hypothetical protein